MMAMDGLMPKIRIASVFDEIGYATEGYACNDGIDNNNNGMIIL